MPSANKKAGRNNNNKKKNTMTTTTDSSLSDGSYSSMASGTPLLEESEKESSALREHEEESRRRSSTGGLISSSFPIGLPNIISNQSIITTTTTEGVGGVEIIPDNSGNRRHSLHSRYSCFRDKNNNNYDTDVDDDNSSINSDISVEEQILKVADQIEDEFDELAYDQLVPLEIKLALEHNVFGWSHLTSDILGHLAFTVAAFGLTFGAFYLLLPRTLIWLRWTLSVMAAVSSFRMVRRRRKIWLRAPYGSARYLQTDRTKEIQQVDVSWLSKLRTRQKVKKVEKKLRKADDKFSRSIEKHRERGARIVTPPSPGGDYIAPLSPVRNNNGNGNNGDNSPLMSSLNKRRRLSFRTESVAVMQSVQHDQIMFANGIIRSVPYSHGGGFGAAPFMLANPHWISVLRHLMPDVYVEISRRVAAAPPHRLIHWAENNPVVAAYTTAHELEFNGKLPNIEWDVFLDPHLVSRVQVVLRERRTFLLSVLPELPTVKPMEKLPEFEELTASQRNVVKYYEVELRKRVQDLVDCMLIAHGNLAQLALEQTGCFKYYNYSRVKRTRRTLGGGIYARQWMAVFAEALHVGVLEESSSSSPTATPSKSSASASSSSPKAHASLMDMTTFSCPNTSMAASVSIVRHVAKREDPFGLVLDVKSRHVPPQVWACVVDILRESGVRVEGIGHFVMDELRSVSQHTVRPVKELIFFHSAGDLQQACHSKRIRYGDTVFFNAGSLLWTPNSSQVGLYQKLCGSFNAEATKQSYRIQPFAMPSRAGERSYNTISGWTGSTIEDYKRRYNLSIGMYVQEFAIDDAAANILVQLINDNPQIYDLGLSWGGVNGITLRGIRPGRFTDTSGFWNQRHIGAVWDSGLRPPV